jgi:peptidyl-prolyl cis-trans isomerase SurA
MLMKEYRDGILLFELTDQKVWGRAVRDTTGLEAFYKAHEQEHLWPTRYEADLYICQNAAVAKQVRGLLKKGKRGQEVLSVVNKTNPLALELDGGTFSADQKPFLNGLSATGLSADLAADGRVVIADVKKIVPPTPKTLDETRGSVTAAYQDSLEKAWIQELRAKYVVTVDRSVLYSIK